jgi:hypothetical protein
MSLTVPVCGCDCCFVCTHALVTVALVVSSKCLRSSVHVRLYTRIGIETLVVLFKCLESSMHKLLYICMGVETLVCFVQVSRVVHA